MENWGAAELRALFGGSADVAERQITAGGQKLDVLFLDGLTSGGDIIVVSQFTLMASTKKGNRPSWIHAAPHELSVPLYEKFCSDLSTALGKPVGTGEFGADMKVELLNDGPVTICIDTKHKE